LQILTVIFISKKYLLNTDKENLQIFPIKQLYFELSSLLEEFSVIVQELDELIKIGEESEDDRIEFLSLATCKFFIKILLLLSTTLPFMCSIFKQAPIIVSRYLQKKLCQILTI